MANSRDWNLTIPLKLDAFVLNEALSNPDPNKLDEDQATEAKIAPITQPNYTFLQLQHQLLQHDILDPVDLHNAFPASSNSRLYDLGKGEPRTNRMGVYLHWVMPRFYRTGTAATPSAAPDHGQQRKAQGLHSAPTDQKPDYSAPAFRQLPNRWLVIRKLDPSANTTKPEKAPIPAVESWVIESDRIQEIDKIPAEKDLQVDVSPYITSNSEGAKGIKLNRQAEIFIGYKESTATWKENKDPTIKRVDLTAVNSSNQLFLDYQPHCSNVFSTVDGFEYKDGGTTKRLEQATADYYVIGWHSDEKQAPFGYLNQDVSREERLKSLSMLLKGDKKDWPSGVSKWLTDKGLARSVCHGAMYNVVWNRNKRPEKIPANQASEHLLNSMPVTVGTTPIDSLLSYIDCHKHTGDETPEQKKLENDLHMLEPLLRAQDEKVDLHRVAVDEVQNWNFARESGGSHWHLQSGDGEKATTPSDGEIEALETLNNVQQVLDSTQRQIVQLQWDMFAHWWRYVSGDVDSPMTQTEIDSLWARVKDLRELARQQKKLIQTKLLANQTAFPQKPQEGVLREFSQPRDPTLLVSGIEAGWPDDYLDDLQVRLESQLIPGEVPDSELALYGVTKLPEHLVGTAKALVGEFTTLKDPKAGGDQSHPVPVYHDRGKHNASESRDQWADTQPWAPLFLEWQAEYFHIPWADWSLSPGLSPQCNDQIDKRWRLGIDPSNNLLDPQINDKRVLSGRILLLPQPSFSLHASIVQLLNSVSPEVKKKYNIEELAANTWKLPFLSAPLDGFTDHLLTMVHGTHIKPNARIPGGYQNSGVRPIEDALVAPFKKDHLEIVDIYSEQTPYGALLSNSLQVLDQTEPRSSPPHPFKPVTHGQFRFSKLNIIDKFGQAINAIDARYGHENDQAIYPYLSSYYEPQLYEGKPNLVRPNGDGHEGHVEFAQVPPAINQPARLNTAFVTYDKRHKRPGDDYSYWRPVTEWENPIWGWVVLNYVDNGIQIFLPDGTFYREVRVTAPNAPQYASASAKWLPFPPPDSIPKTAQIDRLIEKLTNDRVYLQAFLNMANESQKQSSSSSAPSAYAGFLTSLVGRPLALVNAGWSLELSIDEKKNQALSGTEQQPVHLLPDHGKTYDFPIKLGDKDRASDGLVGYFHLRDVGEGKELPHGDELDLSSIYTYYIGEDKSGKLKDISDPKANPPPKVTPFWLTPDNYNGKDDDALIKKAKLYTRNWNQKLKVFGAIIDPFLPITTFSSILPMNNLQLPPWTWQQAMRKMTAFFHLGPMVVTADVEKYRANTDDSKPLPPNYQLDPTNDPTVKNSAVGLPALQSGNWAWLQPFLKGSGPAQEYKSLGLGKVDSAPGYEPGPYTALEGYLQLKQPIVRPDVNERGEGGDPSMGV